MKLLLITLILVSSSSMLNASAPSESDTIQALLHKLNSDVYYHQRWLTKLADRNLANMINTTPHLLTLVAKLMPKKEAVALISPKAGQK